MSIPELPTYLAERLAEDQARFGNNSTKEELDKSIAEHTKRHEALLAEKVQHAKDLEGHHHHHSTLESNVQAKKEVIENQQQELQFLEERLKLAGEKERELKERLGIRS